MEKIFFVFLILFYGYTSQAQIGVGPIEMVKMTSGKFTKEQINKIKSSKTVFVYRPSDDVAALKKAIEEVWTITEISFIPFSEIKNIDLKTTSVFSISGVNTNVTSINERTFSNLNYDNTHIYLNLWMQGKGKKGKTIKESFARIELHPSFVDYANVTGRRQKDALTYIYEEGTLKNWNIGFLKNYLRNVNKMLSEGEERWLYESDNTHKELKKLKSKTLYIPDYAMVKFNKFSGDESKRLDEGKMQKAYPYKSKIISADDLSKKILESEEAFYYMVYVKSSTDKYIYIFNSKTGVIVYSKYKGGSYNLKDSDMKMLGRFVKK